MESLLSYGGPVTIATTDDGFLDLQLSKVNF